MKRTANILAIALAAISGGAIAATAHAAVIPATDLELWLKGDTGVVEADGKVIKWEDQSGEHNDLVEGTKTGIYGFGAWTRTANSPAKATERGHSVVRFDGNDYLHNHSGFATGNSLSAFFVVDENVNQAGYHNFALMGATGYDAPGNNYAQSLEWGGSTIGGNFKNATLVIDDGTEALATDTFKIVELRKDNASGGSSQVYVNGVLMGTSGTGTQTVNSGIFLGGWHWGKMNGDMAEVLIYRAAIDTDDRQLVEGILAWKYGLQTSLPNDHPYRNSNPIPEPASLSLLLIGALGWWRLKGGRRSYRS